MRKYGYRYNELSDESKKFAINHIKELSGRADDKIIEWQIVNYNFRFEEDGRFSYAKTLNAQQCQFKKCGCYA